MKFKKPKEVSFEYDGVKGWNYNTKEDFGNISVCYAEIKEPFGKVKSEISDRLYYILEGEVEFVVNGEKFNLGKEEVLIVPKNTVYSYFPKSEVVKLLEVNSPSFDSDYDVKLE
jgi:mannose-6-phosphate isomerase-like protein (cupin superfamily)